MGTQTRLRRSRYSFTSCFCTDTATTEISTLFPTRRSSDLSGAAMRAGVRDPNTCRNVRHRGTRGGGARAALHEGQEDRKSTRLNSSHEWISYAVFCLKKKNTVVEATAGNTGVGLALVADAK